MRIICKLLGTRRINCLRKLMERSGTPNLLLRGEQDCCCSKEKLVYSMLEDVYKNYTPKETILSFNGGKDCTLLLHIISQYIQVNADLCKTPLKVLYIRNPDTFEEIDQFVKKCERDYDIELIQSEGSIKPMLENLCKEHPELKVVFMGSRRTDPHCENLKHMQQTDPGWPKLLRVMPILDWTCKDVWKYLIENKVPYCKLYDQGYTSIGGKSNTEKNPHLRQVDAKTGQVTYKPAYDLIDDDTLERAGRG